MRRRIGIIVTGAALLISGLGLLTPSKAATVLCPPGCVVAGTIKATGGVPDPTRLTIYGGVTAVASTRSGDIANVASVGQTYYLYVDGAITTGPGGAITGTVLFHASSFTAAGYDSFGGYVSVTGTASALQFNGNGLQASLLGAAGTYVGTVTSETGTTVSPNPPSVGGALYNGCRTGVALVGGIELPELLTDNVRGDQPLPVQVGCDRLRVIK